MLLNTVSKLGENWPAAAALWLLDLFSMKYRSCGISGGLADDKGWRMADQRLFCWVWPLFCPIPTAPHLPCCTSPYPG